LPKGAASKGKGAHSLTAFPQGKEGGREKGAEKKKESYRPRGGKQGKIRGESLERRVEKGSQLGKTKGSPDRTAAGGMWRKGGDGGRGPGARGEPPIGSF